MLASAGHGLGYRLKLPVLARHTPGLACRRLAPFFACPGVRRMNPVYDAAYYEDLAGQLYGLVIRLGDRLSGDEAQWLHHVTEVGEYGLALDDMAKILAYGKIAITDRGGARRRPALAERMKSEDGAVPQALRPARGPKRPSRAGTFATGRPQAWMRPAPTRVVPSEGAVSGPFTGRCRSRQVQISRIANSPFRVVSASSRSSAGRSSARGHRRTPR